jgi:dipeptidyl aminopeptidase/acylaminoacyl peptidase
MMEEHMPDHLAHSLFAGLIALTVGAAGCASPQTQTETDKSTTAEASADQKGKMSGESAVELIDRDTLFGNPDRKSVQVSPDGTKLAYLAPDEGVMNVWVAPIDDLEAAEPVTDNRDRGIPWYQWAYTNDDLLFGKDKDGNENWHIHRVDLDSGEQTDLTPFKGVSARIQELSPEHPETILAAINKRTKKFHDLYRIDLESGDSELVQKNEGKFAGWITDDSLEVRLASRQTKTGGSTYFRPDGEGSWEPFIELSRDDALTTQVIGFDQSGDTLHMLDNRGRDKAAFVKIDMESGDREAIFEPEKADVNRVVRHPKTHAPQAASTNYKRKRWEPLDDEFAARLEAAQKVYDGELGIASRSLEGDKWILSFEQDDGPVRYYRFDPEARSAEFLFVHRDKLEGEPLAEMEPVVIESRDGLELVSYLTLPPWRTGDNSRADEPMPLIINVHGGPWARDKWGYNPVHQWLANRGYAVLSVNFRGSTGFGKSFLNAGDKEWGRKMHHDLLDARKWAIEQGITTEDQVGIMGGSYGGYATLVGMTMTPEKFAAGVDIVGPSNLQTLLESVPPYWKPMFEMMAARIGDPRTEEGKKLLKKRSPLTHADQIENPLLIGQGANDPRVKQAESDQIVEAMQEKNVPVTYALYPDEGHGFQRPENRMSFFAVAEHFLAEHLGGRAKAIGDDFESASLRIPAGAKHLAPVQRNLCELKPKRCEAAE